MKKQIGTLEQKNLNKLIEHGYDAMVVGGAVRDFLLGENINDVDITTNAPYHILEEIMNDIAPLQLVGKNFGVLLVGGVEVATYRIDHYDNTELIVETTNSIVQDSIRRDFTINSIYYDFKNDSFVDFHDGMGDIKHKLITTVGNPYDRFSEDYSRILRALYLSAKLDFSIGYETGNAIKKIGHKLKEVPNALVGKIIKKTIQTGNFNRFMELLKLYDLLQYVFPELVHTINAEQNPKYHKFDVWNHIIAVVKSAEIRHKGNVAFVMGALLHDVAKGLPHIRFINKNGQPSDLGHEEAGVPIAKRVCERLELGKETVNQVVMFVKWHGEQFVSTEKSIKYFLFKFKNDFRNIVDLKENFNALLDFMICDAEGFTDDFGSERKKQIELNREVSIQVFEKQIFFSNQFEFNAGVIAKHPKMKQNEIKNWIEFFLKNNIKEENKVLNILNKQ